MLKFLNIYICKMKIGFLYALIFLISVTSCTSDDNSNSNGTGSSTMSTPLLNYSVLASYPHDTSSFTQGLTFYNGELYEGTGLEGKSRIMQVDLKTGKAIRSTSLDPQLFGEGITILNDTIYQLTWQNKKVLVYTARDFKLVREMNLNTEGWGITDNGEELIVSTGDSNLYFYDASDFRLLRTLGITENGSPAPNLNELEFINGYVYANQWQYPYILKIDPSSGQVVAKLDLTDIVNRAKAKDPKVDFLNGIAYNPETKKIYVTGKLWPEIYELDFPH